MKKSVIALFSVGVLFFVCSLPMIFNGNIGEFFTGIVLSVLFFLLGFRKHSKDKIATMESANAKQEEERRKHIAAEEKRKYEETHGKIECKISGVTFKNDDGTSRQRILSALYREVGYDGGEEASLQPYKFEGRPAVYVLVGGKIVGNIPHEYSSEVCKIVGEKEYFAALHVRRFRNEENKLIYNADIVIEYCK